jgi:translation initiation factor IF-2
VLQSFLRRRKKRKLFFGKKKKEPEAEVLIKNLPPAPPVEKKTPVEKKEKEPEKEKEKEKEPAPEKEKPKEIVEVKAEVIEQPKVLGTIDLDKLDTKTRPEKKKPAEKRESSC